MAGPSDCCSPCDWHRRACRSSPCRLQAPSFRAAIGTRRRRRSTPGNELRQPSPQVARVRFRDSRSSPTCTSEALIATSPWSSSASLAERLGSIERAGTIHWAPAGFVVVAGGGLRHGPSHRRHRSPCRTRHQRRSVHPGNPLSTLYHVLGIDSSPPPSPTTTVGRCIFSMIVAASKNCNREAKPKHNGRLKFP